MATSPAERLEKARQAKLARASGTESQFIEQSRQARKAEDGQANLNEAASVASSGPSAPLPKSGAFSALASTRNSIEDDAAATPIATATHLPAQPVPGAFGKPLTVDATPSPVAARSRFGGLAEKSNNLRIQLDEEEANLPSRRVAAPAVAMDPDPAWDFPTLPAGSDFNESEWEAAREGGKYHVFEVRAGSEGALFQAERAPKDLVKTTFMKGVAIKVTTPAPPSDDHIEPLYGELFDGCLLLGPKAKTTHPNATTGSGRIEMRLADGVKWPYKIIRPASQAETHGWLATVKGWIDLKGAAPGKLSLVPDVTPDPMPEVQQQVTSTSPENVQAIEDLDTNDHVDEGGDDPFPRERAAG